MRNTSPILLAFVLFLSVCLCSSASGQREFGFSMPYGVKKVEIKFEQFNNLIVIPVTINKFLTLKFILDTGVENAILTEKLFADLLDANYVRELVVAGPGLADSVEVLVTNNMTFSLPGGLIGKNMNMLVLKEDYLELSENMGDEIYGIIGYDVFSRFIVEINYDTNKLILHDPAKYKPKKRLTAIPIEIRHSKPYLKTSISQSNQTNSLDIMVDTGASHAALIDFGFYEENEMPENRIITRLGQGLAGEIPGYLSRLDTLSIADFTFEQVLFSSPFEGVYNKSIKRGSKYGTIGGELLHRFNVTIDYHNEMMYFEKSNRFRESFEYDMSGLTLNAKGKGLEKLEVVSVKEDSPASESDIREGDVILSINSRHLRNSKLSDINALLRKRAGLKVKCRILRDGEKIKKTFYLKRMI
ncbi:MAG: aspartyl protease family protein [Cyclobacteriaceae bacterium]